MKYPEDTKLTLEEVRKHQGFHDICEDQASELIDFIHTFSILAYETYVSNPDETFTT